MPRAYQGTLTDTGRRARSRSTSLRLRLVARREQEADPGEGSPGRNDRRSGREHATGRGARAPAAGRRPERARPAPADRDLALSLREAHVQAAREVAAARDGQDAAGGHDPGAAQPVLRTLGDVLARDDGGRHDVQLRARRERLPPVRHALPGRRPEARPAHAECEGAGRDRKHPNERVLMDGRLEPDRLHDRPRGEPRHLDDGPGRVEPAPADLDRRPRRRAGVVA